MGARASEPLDSTADGGPEILAGARTPSAWQTFFAKNRPRQLWTLMVVMAAVIWTVRSGEITPVLLLEWPGLLWALGAIALTVFIAAIVGLIAGGILLLPLYETQERKNGGPFALGDVVQVIAGRHAGRVGRVYDYGRHLSLRVDVGPHAAADYSDYFSGCEVMMVKPIDRT